MICSQSKERLQEVLDWWREHRTECTPCTVVATILRIGAGRYIDQAGLRI